MNGRASGRCLIALNAANARARPGRFPRNPDIGPKVCFRPIADIAHACLASTMDRSEKQLPAEILQRAHVQSGELAWRPSDIPDVIEAAKWANLVSLGGNLQVRVPSGKWGESIYASVDTGRVPDDLPWERRVEDTAKAALDDFLSLQAECDFHAVARDSFPSLLEEVQAGGGIPEDAIYFSWLVVDELEDAQLKRS